MVPRGLRGPSIEPPSQRLGPYLAEKLAADASFSCLK